MSKKTFVSVKRGLISDPKHRARIGKRIWTFLHIIDRADYETGTVYDWRDKDEAQDAGLNWRTMQRQRQELSDLGYIDCQLNGRGMEIVIFNWHNPRSYSGKAINPRSKDLKDTEETDAAEYADLGTQSTQESTHTSTQAPNTNLRTPTYVSQVTDHSSQEKKKNDYSPEFDQYRIVFERELGIAVYGTLSDDIKEWANKISLEIFEQTCIQAARSGIRRPNYVFKVLESKLLGEGDKKPDKNYSRSTQSPRAPSPPPVPDISLTPAERAKALARAQELKPFGASA